MKNYRLFLVLPLLFILAVAIGCDSDNNIKAQDGQEPPPELDGITCPCFTVSDIVTVAEQPDNAGGCNNGNFFFLLSFINQKETIGFFLVCENFDFGSEDCGCSGNNTSQSNLSLDEYTACVNVILNGLIQAPGIASCTLGGG